MCFYPYCPRQTIRVEFLTESIYLSPFGSSRTVADILIKNASEENLDHLVFLYPNCFYEVDEKRVPIDFKEYGFKNRTDELKDKDNPQNFTYEASGYSIERPTTKPNTVEIYKPNPENFDSPHKFSGMILDGSNNDFIFFPHLTDKTLLLLQEISFSILQYNFITELEPGEKRWIRLVFYPKRVAVYYPPLIKMILLWLMDTLKFNYHIMGPFDVLRMFKERLEIFRHLVTKKLSKRGYSSEDEEQQLRYQLEAVDELNRKVIESLDNSKSTFEHLSLHIFPGRLRSLESVYAYGQVAPTGAMPNYLPEKDFPPPTPSWKRRVYDWLSGNLSDKNTDFFNIFFTGHSSNRVIQGLLLVVGLWVVIMYVLSENTLRTTGVSPWVKALTMGLM